MSGKVVFKTYNQNQLSLLPPGYDDLVPVNHPVGIVNTNKTKRKQKVVLNKKHIIPKLKTTMVAHLKSCVINPSTIVLYERNYNLIQLKLQVKTLLTSDQGIAKEKQRCCDVKAVFGNIKHNINFKRFMLRGIDKIKVEIGLIVIAHNLKKYSLAI